MKFTPISEGVAITQANAFRLWPRGIYDYEVLDAKDRVSKSGNDMIELKLKIINAEGKERQIFDYLVEVEAMAYKIRHFASASCLLPTYEQGELCANDCLQTSGRLQLGIQKGKDGYPDKNTVQDYVPTVEGAARAPLIASKAPEDMDDEIPF